MKKTILIIFVLIFTCGCEESYKEINQTIMPRELKDCQIFEINLPNGETIYVTKCPMVNTTTSVDKYDPASKTKKPKNHNTVIYDEYI